MTAPRLSAATLGSLDPAVIRPGYDRDVPACGIVHLGVGAFMRAHVAVYCDAVLDAVGGDWAITGVSLRRPDVSEQLEPQDCLYMVAIRDAEQRDYRLVGALKHMLLGARQPEAVVAHLARPETQVVTITVTEKGYCIDAQKGGLDGTHADIVHDLAEPARPVSLVGVLHAACLRRRDTNAGPITILSCDNLPSNGRLLERAVLAFADLAGSGLQGWISEHASFPSTMVDRIVPATTADDVAAAVSATGVYDAGLVCTESFTQWVIEDRFAGNRPAWERVGALLVEDVEPYEKAKLRLLNGAHSALAYLGFLAGHQYVHEAMQDEPLAGYIEYMMKSEISPVTPAPTGMEHDRYIPALLDRFRNPALQHRTWQIAMDGSQKLPQRLLATIRAQLGRGGPIFALSLAVAAWIRYTLGRDENGAAIDVRDPLQQRFAAIAADAGDSVPSQVDGYLALRSVFGEDLPADNKFRQALIMQLESLVSIGSRETIRACLADAGGNG